jgi:hypothetical protein
MSDEEICRWEVEDALLVAGEQLTEAAFQDYLDGKLSREKLKEAYRMLSEWRSTSEKILELIR